MYKAYASVKRRLMASLVDYLIIFVYTVVLLGATLLFYYFFFNRVPFFSQLKGELVSFFFMILPVYLYLVITEYSSKQGTIGKQQVSLFINAADGDSLTLRQILLRNAVKLLPWQLAHSFIFEGMHNNWRLDGMALITLSIVYGLPFVSVLFICLRKDHRSIHDLIAGTAVFECKNSSPFYSNN